jgi:hypothetical protein
MYKQTETTPKATLLNGAEITPIATLKDEYGGVAHIWADDHCYVLGLEREWRDTSDGPPKTIVRPIYHMRAFPLRTDAAIFREAFEVLITAGISEAEIRCGLDWKAARSVAEV